MFVDCIYQKYFVILQHQTLVIYLLNLEIMATKIFKAKRVIYRVEKNENGTLDIYREYYSLKNMNHWEKDGRKFNNAGSLIITAGGIDGLLSQCEDVEDIDAMIADLNEVKAEIRRKANAERERQATERQNIAETEYHQLFDGKDVVETNAKTVYALLRYLNTQNWGLWRLPKMTIGYQCNQYDCDGKTATTIKLDQPIKVAGEMGTQFVYGAPRGHLEKYERIVDWE